jgi:hypothetical protein
MLLAERTGVYREGINTLCRKMQIFVVLITGGIYIYLPLPYKRLLKII